MHIRGVSQKRQSSFIVRAKWKLSTRDSALVREASARINTHEIFQRQESISFETIVSLSFSFSVWLAINKYKIEGGGGEKDDV